MNVVHDERLVHAVEMIKVVDLEKDSLYSDGEFEEFSNLSLDARQSSVQFLDFAVKSAVVLFSLLFYSLFDATVGTKRNGAARTSAAAPAEPLDL